MSQKVPAQSDVPEKTKVEKTALEKLPPTEIPSLTRISPWLTKRFYDYKEATVDPGLGYIKRTSEVKFSLKGYGTHVFRGAIAAPYLEKAGLPRDAISTSRWTTDGSADKVAAAILEWARDNGAFHYCHWFQPLGSAGVRHGQSGQVQNSLCEFNNEGKPVWEFKGKHLLHGETDGSSYPNGGLVIR